MIFCGLLDSHCKLGQKCPPCQRKSSKILRVKHYLRSSPATSIIGVRFRSRLSTDDAGHLTGGQARNWINLNK
jgi:hypothetical protein